jgi:hypothetical protein
MSTESVLDTLLDAFTTDGREFGQPKQRERRMVYGQGKNPHPTKSGPGRKSVNRSWRNPAKNKLLSNCRSHGGR